MTNEIDEPLDLIRLSLGKTVIVKCRNDREIRGKLHAYDLHLNMLLSDVEEQIILTDDNDHNVNNKNNNIQLQNNLNILNITKKNFGLLFLRGDLVILVSPTNK